MTVTMTPSVIQQTNTHVRTRIVKYANTAVPSDTQVSTCFTLVADQETHTQRQTEVEFGILHSVQLPG
jgi:hypothetical protein